MKRNSLRQTFIYFAVLIPLIFVGLYAFAMWRLREDVQIAEKYKYVAQAICDYRAERGLLPDSIDDLVPNYLDELPQDHYVTFSRGILEIRHRRSYVLYCFVPMGALEEGWTVDGVPNVVSTRPALTGDALIRATLAEYDRRIAAKSKIRNYHLQKIAYLVSIDKKQDAYTECKAAAELYPDKWQAQYGLALLAPEADVPATEARFRTWVDKHPSFAHYCFLARYYRERNSTDDALAALNKAVNFPHKRLDVDVWWTAETFAIDAALFACLHQRHELTLKITRGWSSYHVFLDEPLDYLSFRAAANLGLGNLEEAKADITRAIEWSKRRGKKHRRVYWSSNLRELQSAIERGDRSFIYKPEPPAGWMPFTWQWIQPPAP